MIFSFQYIHLLFTLYQTRIEEVLSRINKHIFKTNLVRDTYLTFHKFPHLSSPGKSSKQIYLVYPISQRVTECASSNQYTLQMRPTTKQNFVLQTSPTESARSATEKTLTRTVKIGCMVPKIFVQQFLIHRSVVDKSAQVRILKN